jgi:hypothetical protein
MFRNIILLVALYGCETWSLTLRVLVKRFLRRIFEPKRNEVTREWRILHINELHARCALPNINEVIDSIILRWAGNVARMGEREEAYRALVMKREGWRPLGILRIRLEDDIKIDM